MQIFLFEIPQSRLMPRREMTFSVKILCLVNRLSLVRIVSLKIFKFEKVYVETD
jgi:hypothetical protein